PDRLGEAPLPLVRVVRARARDAKPEFGDLLVEECDVRCALFSRSLTIRFPYGVLIERPGNRVIVDCEVDLQRLTMGRRLPVFEERTVALFCEVVRMAQIGALVGKQDQVIALRMLMETPHQ